MGSLNIFQTSQNMARMAKFYAEEAQNGEHMTLWPTTFSDIFSISFSLQQIFIPLFICAEYSYGTIKTIIARGTSRLKFYFSKLITCIFAELVFVCVELLVMFTYGISALEFGTLPEDIVMRSAGNILVGIASVCFYVAIANVFRYTSASLGANIFFLLASAGGIVVANNLMFSLFSIKIDFRNYWIDTVLYAGADQTTATVVALCYIIIPTIIGAYVFKKRDIS
jgi:ABC-type transport system involved in multi-copper enzyme maturation permease subunit